MYAIDAVVHIKVGDWTGVRQIPTFYLHKNIQGIVSADQARRIAEDIILACVPESDRPNVTIYACAVDEP